MPFKLKYNDKLQKIVAEKWLDDDMVIDSEELCEFRQHYSIEDEIKLLRSSVIAIGEELLPAQYLEQVAQMAMRVDERKKERESYISVAVSLDISKATEADLPKIKFFMSSIGAPVSGEILTLDQLKTACAAILADSNKYETK